ncbi:hypothetical protein EDB92DRAFT_2105035 [Lactarius akahatsu]|uniref:Uncharacterized protein n=1 Tax=Lactarius akahatsu TaxID=416441 RepID=A0AAD4LD63_9AGAM|nr:hypothetical protein EDB92DRAFT_2105035 [Lactarius akahatsu]
MSSHPQTLASSSLFISILDGAESEYKKKTGNDISDNWVAKELHQAEAFDKFMGGNKKLIMDRFIGARPLHDFRDSWRFLLRKQSLLELVSSSQQRMSDQRIQFLLNRLGVHTQISLTKDMAEILVKIVAEVLSILSIATETQQSRTKTFLKKLVGKTDIEDALKSLDNLTREEVWMAIAQVLEDTSELQEEAKKTNKVVRRIANNVEEMQDDAVNVHLQRPRRLNSWDYIRERTSADKARAFTLSSTRYEQRSEAHESKPSQTGVFVTVHNSATSEISRNNSDPNVGPTFEVPKPLFWLKVTRASVLRRRKRVIFERTTPNDRPPDGGVARC